MATVFVVRRSTFDSDYNADLESLAGIYKNRDKAQAWIDNRIIEKKIEVRLTALRMQLWLHLTEMHRMPDCNVNDLRPKFDQYRQRDKEYIKEHTARKRAWEEDVLKPWTKQFQDNRAMIEALTDEGMKQYVGIELDLSDVQIDVKFSITEEEVIE